MTKLDRLIMILKEVRFNFPEYLRVSIEDTKDELLLYITDEQMYNEGITAKGDRIESIDGQYPYSERTKQIKRMKGQPINRVTLRDTGKFHNSIGAKVSNTAIQFDASDPKYQLLRIRYGNDLLGLTQESQREYMREYVLPTISRLIRQNLQRI